MARGASHAADVLKTGGGPETSKDHQTKQGSDVLQQRINKDKEERGDKGCGSE